MVKEHFQSLSHTFCIAAQKEVEYLFLGSEITIDARSKKKKKKKKINSTSEEKNLPSVRRILYS